jgi:hypothetical protein
MKGEKKLKKKSSPIHVPLVDRNTLVEAFLSLKHTMNTIN